MQRRNVLQALVLAPLAFILPRQILAAPPAAPANLLPETDPMANAMKYKHDATKADPTMRKDKTATCGNCAKYAKCSTVDKACKPGKKTDAYAACEIFVGKSVAKPGWCMSWTKA